MASVAKTAATITVRFRTAPNVGASTVSLADADATVLAAARPWREFRWRGGQKHYSGSYWSATRGDMSSTVASASCQAVIFDFDRSVHRIGAQPFWIC